ncbi:hypothetical protein TREES_T100014258 [Tupaia chinensis]|uniref:Uncharacterized protein n=1 Tax=Tupaia chinensis TaxID=246437 RepID=L9JE66_TUPCH|nr:hypothetical protein TREES_T100014258 [Tupaia chinensis]
MLSSSPSRAHCSCFSERWLTQPSEATMGRSIFDSAIEPHLLVNPTSSNLCFFPSPGSWLSCTLPPPAGLLCIASPSLSVFHRSRRGFETAVYDTGKGFLLQLLDYALRGNGRRAVEPLGARMP